MIESQCSRFFRVMSCRPVLTSLGAAARRILQRSSMERLEQLKPSVAQLSTLAGAALRFTEQLKADDYALLRDAIGDARVVMIGEATHGTEDFYSIRAELTKVLIDKLGFNFVAIEGDWPDVFRVNRYVGGAKDSKDASAEAALSDFRRFPRWMWRNGVFKGFVEWMRLYNDKRASTQPDQPPIGIYGLDLYSLFRSAEAVIDYLEKTDPKLADVARERYGTLGNFRDEMHDYATALLIGQLESQRENCTKMLCDLLKHESELSQHFADGEEFWTASENAKLVADAEEYYRKSFSGGVVTWNIRDTHMFNTLNSILRHYDEKKLKPAAGSTAVDDKKSAPSTSVEKDRKSEGARQSKAVVWAHNSHLGDSGATAFGAVGEVNLGYLARKHHGLSKTFNIGFTTFNGSVSAAERWGGSRKDMSINDALTGSYEWVFHRLAQEHKDKIGSSFGFIFRSNQPQTMAPNWDAHRLLRLARYTRAIGVQYVKKTEFQSHYIEATLPHQFDAVIHIDRSSALRPLAQDDAPR